MREYQVGRQPIPYIRVVATVNEHSQNISFSVLALIADVTHGCCDYVSVSDGKMAMTLSLVVSLLGDSLSETDRQRQTEREREESYAINRTR